MDTPLETNNALRNAVRRLSLRDYFPILLLVVLIGFFSLNSPRFFTVQNLFIVLQQSVTLLVVALGMTFVIIGGSIDLSVGSIVGLAALAAASTSGDLGIWAVVPAVFVGMICGLINGVIFAKGKVPSFMVTLGTLVAYRGVVLFFTQGAPISITNRDFLNLYSGRVAGPNTLPNSVIFALIITVIVFIIFNYTVFGRKVRAIGGGERVALLTGIKVDRVKIMTFTMLGVLCGLAGLLQSARVFAATAQLGANLELDAIAAVVVGGTPLTGGVGSVQGTIIGALVTTILSNGMNMMGVDPYLQNIIRGIVLIAAVFITIDRSKIGIIK